MLSQEQQDALAARRSIVADLLLNGWSGPAIAKHVGVHHDTVYEDIKAIRAQWAENQTHSYEEWVQRELQALDDLEAKIAHRIDTGDLQAVQTKLKIQERRTKYLGLDSPTRFVIDDGLTDEIRKLAEEVGMTDSPAVQAIIHAHTG